ncbi:hypothetical protein BASA81_013249 [Batrachochytrium salamandrivorans]|nr:hypothetical protein BASA81_013249 [Batrachochytrium salamandrivorans]
MEGGVRPKVVGLALVFCLGQLVQELIAEAIFTTFEFPQPKIEVAMVYAWFQHMGTVLVAFVSLRMLAPNHKTPSSEGGGGGETRSWLAMVALAGLIFASTVLPNLALEFVHFPAKVVTKSSKLVPTMLVSVCMGNSLAFGWMDYASALLLISGAVVFALASSRESEKSPKHSEYAVVGLGLLTVASLADALVPNIQQVLMRTGQASAQHLAIKVNLIGQAGILGYLLLLGEGEWVAWLVGHPNTLALMTGSGLMLGVAVIAYTMLIREAGSVLAVAVATVRKVATITLSYLVFPGNGKTFDQSHLLAVALVGLGMGLVPCWQRFAARK